MDELDAPASPDELYRDRGEVSESVPLMQGDVFDDISIPAISSEPFSVQVVMHACSMRVAGGRPRERITVAPVTPLPGGYSGKLWATKHVNRMLLPDLRGDGLAYAADFLDVAPAPASELVLHKRVAVLSNDGVMLLQQRYAYSLTRVTVPKVDFGEELEPLFSELEMQETWVERAYVDHGGTTLDDLHQAIADFHAWLDENGRERREKLRQSSSHQELRRELTRELKERFPPTNPFAE